MFSRIRNRSNEERRQPARFPSLPGIAADETPLATSEEPRRGSSEYDVLERAGAAVHLDQLADDLATASRFNDRVVSLDVALDTRDIAPLFSLVDELQAARQLNGATARLALRALDDLVELKCAAVDTQVNEACEEFSPRLAAAYIWSQHALAAELDDLNRELSTSTSEPVASGLSERSSR